MKKIIIIILVIGLSSCKKDSTTNVCYECISNNERTDFCGDYNWVQDQIKSYYDTVTVNCYKK